MSTLTYYLLGSISFLSVIRACLPLNLWRRLLIIFSVFGFYLSAFVLQHLLEIATLTAATLPVYLILMVVFGLVFVACTIKQKYRFD